MCNNYFVGKKLLDLLKLSISLETLVPLIVIISYVLLLIILRGALPTPNELISHAASLYERFGYEVIFTGAALEAMVLINLVVPGITAVALGAVFARSGQTDLAYVIAAASLGAMLGYILDFFLGYFGFGKILKKIGQESVLNKARQNLEKSGIKSFGLGFVHPDVGSFMALAAGTLRMKFIEFMILSVLSTVFWVSFWGLVIFALGDIFLIVLTKYFSILVVMLISAWILINIHSKIKRGS